MCKIDVTLLLLFFFLVIRIHRGFAISGPFDHCMHCSDIPRAGSLTAGWGTTLLICFYIKRTKKKKMVERKEKGREKKRRNQKNWK